MADLIDIEDGDTGLTARNKINNSFTAVNELIDVVGRPAISKPNGICFGGDSITDDSHDANSWNDWGWVSWFRRNLNKSYTVDKGDLFANASMGTVDLLNVQLPQIIASGCGTCMTMIGTNDLGSAVDIAANLEVFYGALSDNQIRAIAMPILPHSDSDPLTDDLAAEASKVNKYLYNRAQVDENLTYMSALSDLTDYTTGNAASGILRDSVHTTKLGGKVLGESIAGLFNSINSGPDEFDYAVGGNPYNVILNPKGNVILNPSMNGTSGSARNGATGVVADDWYFDRSSPAATFTAVASKQNINNLDYQVATLSGTGDGNLCVINTSVPIPADWAEGDVIEGGMTVEATGLGGVGYLSMRLRVSPDEEKDGASTAANGDFPSSVSADYKVKLVIPASPATVDIRLNIQTLSGEPLSGVVKISKVFTEKL